MSAVANFICEYSAACRPVHPAGWTESPGSGRYLRPDALLLDLLLTLIQLLPAALPTLDIAEGALDSIFRLYKQLLPQMGGYLTHAGELNRPRLELLLAELAALEQQTLEQRAQVGT